MRGANLGALGLAATLTLIPGVSTTRAETLAEAWGITLGVNQQLQAQQQSSVAADFNVKAANSARWCTVRSYNIDTFLAQSPKARSTFADRNASGTGTGTGSTLTALPTVFTLGTNQTFLPISLT